MTVSGASTGLLGDLYAFGLLGAFSITCLSLDIVRWHARREGHPSVVGRTSMPMFLLGALTTVLVVIPWLTNLVAKPLATAFGGTLVLIGVAVAFVTNRLEARRGRYTVFPYLHRSEHPIVLLRRGRRLAPTAVLAFLPHDPRRRPSIIDRALSSARARPVVFAFEGQTPPRHNPRFLEVLDPYADDKEAHDAFQEAEAAARMGRVKARYVYVPAGTEPDVEDRLRDQLRPDEVIGAT